MVRSAKCVGQWSTVWAVRALSGLLGFPECRNTKAIVNMTNQKCLACGGNIVQHKSRTGRIFYGCDNYRNAKYVSWDMPIDQKCPVCGTQLERREEKQIICPNKDCPSRQNEVKNLKDAPLKRNRLVWRSRYWINGGNN